MATSGTPWIIEKDKIVEELKKTAGRMTHTARNLGVSYMTLQKKVKEDPEIEKLVSDLRNNYEETMLDIAEDTIAYAMGMRREDLTNANKAAFFVLNSKGASRGYQNTHNYKQDIRVQTVNYSDKKNSCCPDIPPQNSENDSPCKGEIGDNSDD